ncbi:MAG: hypothetical protein V4487_01835 [Chlamydiota bacterium]
MGRKKISHWKFFFLVFALSILAYLINENRTVNVKVLGITSEGDFVIPMRWKDKKRLDYFFRGVCLIQQWAYTLIGSKPVTFTGLQKPFTTKRSLWPSNFRNYLGWKTWLKYQSYFSQSPFLIFPDREPGQEKTIYMTIVDKAHFDRVVRENMQDFQIVLGRKIIDSQVLLNEALLSPFLCEVLKNHDGLIGTVLGYGRENAWAFYNRDEAKEGFLGSAWEPELLDEMIVRLSKKDWSFEAWDLSDLYFPSFAADPESDETKKLKQLYREDREKIVRYYKGKDFVEATLRLLNGNRDQIECDKKFSLDARETLARIVH